MNIFEAIMQGIIQGLTEFLPVSSSGHLSLYQHFTGNSGEGALLFSAVLHLGTLVAVFTAFRKTIWELIKELGFMIKDIFTGKFKWKEMNPPRRAIIMMIISLLMLIPFYIFKDFFEGVSEDSDIIVEGICFLYTATILFLSDRCVKGNKKFGDITVKNAVTVGAFQGVALLPGVSRSGSTISGGLFCGFERETAVQYSFILGIPAILGGCLLQVKDAVDQKAMDIEPLNFAVGFIVSAIVGICAIKMVNWLVKSDKFKIFAVYTLILGVVVIGIGIFEHAVGMNLVDYLKK
ncbi:undecaprenyl-diphosphate phosphatase [Porcipelethomonas ammoniilytica]|uniref:undecaprenyl-diphosphate phosphatase n=1 Tax=Porcipelethomonas TaxID=2981643 RepID=UPI00096935E6|nr:undecaprenyl-diphosphate phosphatase [Porcipelethomonas ammoniilytica]MCU6718796.1 undecaprenyl-diphosphate phosphatase [Porcipelethomonas ammoniilytica]MEE0186463.1 undecaprenyl-diphosphate phosphatase [Oscillospiraceae bacterium]OLA69327.1 MAG: bacilysin biosynthesis protein BacA [Ruminococcus sp. 37_24]